jgi:uncharacterized protein (TIGR04255 family)
MSASAPEPSVPSQEPVTCSAPPVTEVVIGIQLDDPVVDLEVLAEFTARVKTEFPKRSQQPPLPRLQEDLATPPAAQGISFELSTDFTLPRTWFMSDDEAKILQVQADRFIFNWRRPSPDAAEYPRFRTLRQQFAEKWEALSASIGSAGSSAPSVNLCEVTYVNQVQIPGISPGERHPGLYRVLKAVTDPDYDFLPAPEDSQLQGRYRIEMAGGNSDGGGRFYVNAGPAFRPDGLPIYVLNLTARLLPATPDQAAFWNAIDIGHDWIVRGFADLTTEEMHEVWNLRMRDGTR